MSKVAALPYVEEHEVDEARALIDKQFVELTGKPFGFRPAGYMIAVKIYIRPEEAKVIKRDDGTEVTWWNPPVSQQQDKFDSVSALVCAVGPQAYKGFNPDGTPRYPEGPWCRTADWVVIPRQSSFLCRYNGVTMAILPDDKVIGVIQDPAEVTAEYLAPRI